MGTHYGSTLPLLHWSVRIPRWARARPLASNPATEHGAARSTGGIARGSRVASRAWLCLITMLCALVAWPASGQALRDIVAGARLGSGYAQMLSLAATPDVSAASYRVKSAGSDPDLDVLRLPYEARWGSLTAGSDVYWRVAGGYLTLQDDLSVLDDSGTISSKWSAFSVSGGVAAKIGLGQGFIVEPALDVGVARLLNDAQYQGTASILQPGLDNLLFNWHSNAWLVTPNVALEWSSASESRRISVRGHVAWSWIGSFDESDSVIRFDETAGAYSVRAEYAAPTGARVLDRPLDWVVFTGYAGFFGPNRDALGFTSVAEVGAGLETPRSTTSTDGTRVRVGASYLFGPDVRGWSVSVGLRY